MINLKPTLFRPSTIPLRPLLSIALILLTACTGPRPFRGGRATSTPTISGLAQTLSQSDNPSTVTRQTQTTIRTRTCTLPPTSSTLPLSAIPPISQVAKPATCNLLPATFAPSPSASFSPLPPVQLFSETEQTTATTELGAAQKDTAREVAAKLSSLKGIVWVGLGLFLFGLATIFWAPLRAVIGSLTTSLAITGGGLALIILPTLIVGHELLILGAVGALVLAWFLAHRHGQLRGQLLVQSQSQLPQPDQGAVISAPQKD